MSEPVDDQGAVSQLEHLAFPGGDRLRQCHFILFVKDQAEATAFYSRVLQRLPSLQEPGMSEFALGDDAVLGRMPRTGIPQLLGVADREVPSGSAAELYLLVEAPHEFHTRAVQAGLASSALLLIGTGAIPWHTARPPTEPSWRSRAPAER